MDGLYPYPRQTIRIDVQGGGDGKVVTSFAPEHAACDDNRDDDSSTDDSKAMISSTCTATTMTTTTYTAPPEEEKGFISPFQKEAADPAVMDRFRTSLCHGNLIDVANEQKIVLRQASEACFQRRTDPTAPYPHFLMITGPSGCGKTRLARSLPCCCNEQQEHSCYYYVLSGKFNLRSQLQPYEALVAAFADLAPAVLARDGAADPLRAAIAAALSPQEAAVLVNMIPSLKALLNTTTTKTTMESEDQVVSAAAKSIQGEHNIQQKPPSAAGDGSDGVQRFVLVFRSFLQAICSLRYPIVLFLDDLHWADACSLDVLRSVVADQHAGLFIVGTADDSRLWVSSSSLVELLKESCVTIRVNNLDRESVGRYVAQALESGEDEEDAEDEYDSLVDTLCHQTGGNPLYMKEFLLWLQDAGTLYYNSRKRKWEWDNSSIDSSTTHGPRTITDFLKDKVEASPCSEETKEVLKVASCFGSHRCNDRLIEYVLGYAVSPHLKEATSCGFLEAHDDGSYSFAHDSVQDAVYRLIPESERELYHVEVGRRLWRKLSQEEVDRYIFLLLAQFDLGRRHITRQKERMKVATLCLHGATKSARATSYFSTAVVCLELGISLMGDKGWRDNYDLTLALHNAGAEMEMCTANFDRMNMLIDRVVRRGRNPLDKAQALGSRVYALGVSGRQQEAIDLGIEVLNSLGETMPIRRFTANIVVEMTKIQTRLKGRSDEQLMRLPYLQDPHKFACLNILQLMFLNCLMLRPELAPLVSMKIVRISLQHGLSPLAAVGYAGFAMFHLSMKRIDAANRFAGLSLKLLEFFGSVEYIPRVYAAVYGVIHPWKNPIRESLEPLLRAHRIGLQTGDLEFAHLCSSSYIFLAYKAGIELNSIMQRWSIARETMVFNQQTTMLNMALPFIQCIEFCINPKEDPLSYAGKWINLKAQALMAEKAGLKTYLADIQSCCMIIAYTFGALEEAASYLDVFRWQCRFIPTIQFLHLHFYKALLCLALAGAGKQKSKHIRAAKKTLRKLKYWAVKTPHNALDKRFLVEAELASVLGKPEKAYEKYTCAIALAKDAGILWMIAMAHECLGHHFYRNGQIEKSRAAFDTACDFYNEWGGKAKAAHVKRKIVSLFAS